MDNLRRHIIKKAQFKTAYEKTLCIILCLPDGFLLQTSVTEIAVIKSAVVYI